MFIFFPSYKPPFFRGWSIATVDYRGGISIKTTKPQVSAFLPRFFPLDFTGNAQIVKCFVTSLSAELSDPNMNIWKFPQYATREKHTYICNKSSFEYASTSTMKPPPTSTSNVPKKKVALATGRPSDWLVRSLAEQNPWMVSKRRLWNGKLSKSEKQKSLFRLTCQVCETWWKEKTKWLSAMKPTYNLQHNNLLNGYSNNKSDPSNHWTFFYIIVSAEVSYVDIIDMIMIITRIVIVGTKWW